ncbi:hypothetical protein C662_08385 [Thauera sp. 28]|uniref:DUF4124 domain-containing protein n=1 Tax=Thauera sp. 28 TaxID=303682 RepID=UPI0002CE1CB6|nr:DUF4124 domain-containing protein [Thauera sp. 28]ENO93256.1 hypothetical protein C662_08385 [Thauera sp. 28]
MSRPAVVLLALLIALPASAQIYRWTDSAGQVHFTDTPPPSEDYAVIQRPRTTAAPTPAAVAPEPAPESEDETAEAQAGPQTTAEREQALRKRRLEKEEAEAKQQDEAAREAERKRFCEDTANQITALRSGQRVSRFNARGEREFLDDSARAAETERLERQIAEHCR